MNSNKEVISYLENISLFLLGILFLVFPIFVLDITTDSFLIPKQVMLIGFSLLILVLQSVKMILEKSIKIRRTPFDLPIIIFTVVTLVSCLLAVNRIDAIMTFVPFLFAIILYFFVVNFAKDKNSVLFLQSSLVGGAAIASVITILSYFKIYLLPFAFSHQPTFSLLGNLLDQAIYLGLVLTLIVYPFLLRQANLKQIKGERAGMIVGGIVVLIGFCLTVYQVLSQKPIILPFQFGFQTAFAAISQDTGRIAQGFFFGSGFGTFMTDFTRFKQATFNLTPYWAVSFYQSSSFILELLATVGVLGLVSFVYLIYKVVKEKPFFPPLILAFVVLFLLPFNFTNQVLFFILLGLFAALSGLRFERKYFDIELQLVALKKGLIAFEAEPLESKSERSKSLPIIVFVLILAVSGTIGYFTTMYLMSNINFEKSIVAASQNDGTKTYQAEAQGLSQFSYSDAYQRLFSQTNLALANNLAAAVQKSGGKPSAQTSQTIYTLIQQSINAARNATTLSPQTSINWQNLSTIYRALIGFGQNADQFSVLTAQQAITLDPNNPQLYIMLGGIYYQLQAWDKAAEQFQVAINIKQDYANAYYNLGHTYEERSDYKSALAQYQIVKTLVANDPTNLKKITDETSAVEAKSGQQAAQAQNTGASAEKQNLNVNTPSATLPPQTPPVKIPAPKPTSTPSATPTPTPAQ